MNMLDWVHSIVYADREEKYEKLQNTNIELSQELFKKEGEVVDLKIDITFLKDEIARLKKLFEDGWSNPYNWKNYTGSFNSITGLRIPFNTFLTPQDKELKALVMKQRWHKVTISEAAQRIQEYLYKNVRYVYDHENNWHPNYAEYFQTASFTWQAKQGDCDDFAILFCTLMHILGYGDRVICEAGTVKGATGKLFNHCYNRVLISGQWEVFDAEAGQTRKVKNEYPEMKDAWFKFNYYGVFS